MTSCENAVKANSKRRGYGYSPINSYQEGMEYHHMFLNDDSDIGIWVPKPLHKLIFHNSITGHGMKDMNKAALFWLACQNTISYNEEKVEYRTDYTDNQIIDAVRSCFRKTTVTSAEVAAELNCKREYAKTRLKELAAKGELVQKLVNTTLCFKLPTRDKQFFEIQNHSGETVQVCEEGETITLNGMNFIINRVED